MKKTLQIIPIFLISIFAFKITSYLILNAEKYEMSCEMDRGETESPEENEKDIKEKDVLQEGKLADLSKLIIDPVKPGVADRYMQNGCSITYLEVCSPPPEFV